jgi:hypothetical protein
MPLRYIMLHVLKVIHTLNYIGIYEIKKKALLFQCGSSLFNDAVDNYDYIESNDRMTSDNHKALGKKQ